MGTADAVANAEAEMERNMLKRENWYLLFGVFFLVIAVLSLLVSRWFDTAWCGLLGGGSLYVFYAQKHPALGRGKLAWAGAIIYIILLAVVFILRWRTV